MTSDRAVRELESKSISDAVCPSADLMEQKKASDRAVRKLESKLIEAGVDPSDIERAIAGRSAKIASSAAKAKQVRLSAWTHTLETLFMRTRSRG